MIYRPKTTAEELEEIRASLPLKLRRLRESAKLTRYTLSKELSAWPTTISNHELGVKLPYIKTLLTYSTYYQVCLNWLLDGDLENPIRDTHYYVYNPGNLEKALERSTQCATKADVAQRVPDKHYTIIYRAFRNGIQTIPNLIRLKNALGCTPKDIVCGPTSNENYLHRSLFPSGTVIPPIHPRGDQDSVAQSSS